MQRKFALLAAATLGAMMVLSLTAAAEIPAPEQASKFIFLQPAQVDADIKALAAPPADGSDTAKAELAELKQIEGHRTPAELARATDDERTKNATIFAAAVGPGFDLKRLPATAKLFADVRADEKSAADQAKLVFKRNRPWIIDPALSSCSKGDEAQSSYPSGHSTMGYTMAHVLVTLAPEKADAIMARADDYAHSRLICEVHFRSDVAAGRTFGALLARDMEKSPAFKAEFDASSAELRAAHLTQR